MKPCSRARPPNELQHNFIAIQRLPSPVAADEREHAVFDPVPLRGPGWVVHDRDDQAELVRQLLQFHLPSPSSTAVGSAAISLDQQTLRACVVVTTDFQPPTTEGGDGKRTRLLRGANDHIPGIPTDVEDP